MYQLNLSKEMLHALKLAAMIAIEADTANLERTNNPGLYASSIKDYQEALAMINETLGEE